MNTPSADAPVAFPPGIAIRRFSSPLEAATALAEAVAADLSFALRERGRASLAVGGGTTPATFLSALGAQPIDWADIRVTLTDERWVPAGHPRANATLVAATLLQGAARACEWYPLYCDGLTSAEGVIELNARLASLGWPLDVVVLGMGTDGHVASLFPASQWNSQEPACAVIPAISPGGEDRVSLTMQSLRAARQRYLLIHGREKEAVLRSADRGALPIGALLAGSESPVIAFIAPEGA